jgi:hypothetical protein
MPQSFEFEVTLRGARPRVWRRFLLATNATFRDLHDAIQLACGWRNCHLYSFRDPQSQEEVAGIPDLDGWDDVEVPDAQRTRLTSWFHSARKKIDYLYDFGDGWHHDVRLLQVVDHDERHKRKLLGGARAFPPEDCGGIRGYERCVSFVKTGKDPQRDPDEPDALRVWLGRWNPERFDLEAVRKKFDSRPAPKPALLLSPSASAAKTAAVPRERNAWCVSLGVDVPDVATVAARKSVFGPVRLADLVVVALIENGGPLSDDEVLQRLREAGIDDTKGDLAKRLKRSLASTQAPILRDHANRLTVDLKSDELNLMLFTLGIRGPRIGAVPPPPPPPASDGALTPAEVDAAYRGRITDSDTKARFVIAVLDAEQTPMTFAQLQDRFAAYGGGLRRLTDTDLKLFAKRTDLIVDGDVLRLADDADLRRVRAAIRLRAKSALDAERRAAQREIWHKDYKQKQLIQKAAAASLRRAVFVATPRPEAPTSIVAFDFAGDARVAFSGPTLAADFAGWIASFDVVVGVRPHLTLGALGVDFHRFQKVVDLRPTKKTHTVDGRQLPIVWNAIVDATLGCACDPEDVGTLVAFYRYVLLHGLLRFPAWGGALLASIPVAAGAAGDVLVTHALNAARDAGDVVTLWVDSPPELSPPPATRTTSALVRGRVVEVGHGDVSLVEPAGRVVSVQLTRIHSVDVTGGDELAWRLPVTWRR